jgi:hypothetical protein
MMLRKCWIGLCCVALIIGASASAHAQLIDNGDGTVLDTGTGLMWQAAAPEPYTWAKALSYCENLSLGEQSDWRMPTIKELDSIVDLSRSNPTINTDFFPDAVGSVYWSSTTWNLAADTAWCMDLYNGSDFLTSKIDSYYVRAVRGGQSGSVGILVIAQTPLSGPPGATFAQWGTGFTPDSTATLHLQKPDGVEYPTRLQAIDAIGHFEAAYTTPYDQPGGNYTWWAVDGQTGQNSNSVAYAIGNVDLADAMAILQTLAGLSSSGVRAEAEITGDGEVGIEEAVYILQKTAGLR